MRASHELSRVEVSFDDPNLVSHAGLLQAASLWQRLGMPGVVRRGLRLPGSVGANSDAKVATVIMGMLAGADSIDDLDVLRAGATGRLLRAAKAASTIGNVAAQLHLRASAAAGRDRPAAAPGVLGRGRRAAPPGRAALPGPGLHDHRVPRAGQAGCLLRLHRGPRSSSADRPGQRTTAARVDRAVLPSHRFAVHRVPRPVPPGQRRRR